MSAKKPKQKLNATSFLCIALALIAVFVAAVCVIASKKNRDLVPGDTVKTTENGTVTTASGSEKVTAGSTKAAQSTTETKTTASTAGTTKAPTTKAPATPFATEEATFDPEKWNLTLVNRKYRVPDSYSPDLVYVCDSGEQLDKKVAVWYEKMYKAGKADGVTLTPCSGYRSYATQERNYNNQVSYYKGQGYSDSEAKTKAATIILPPGFSEHHLGYAMDIVCVDEWFEDTAEFKWLNEHAADYGFILRYPADKTKVTNIIYEPWHWRYVGVETAKAIKAKGVVLEEYLGVN